MAEVQPFRGFRYDLARVGSLSGVVALTVGLLTFPLSLLADRWGRIRSLTLMAGAVINALRYELHDTGSVEEERARAFAEME